MAKRMVEKDVEEDIFEEEFEDEAVTTYDMEAVVEKDVEIEEVFEPETFFDIWMGKIVQLVDSVKKGSLCRPLHFITSESIYHKFKKESQKERVKRISIRDAELEGLRAEKLQQEALITNLGRKKDPESKAVVKEAKEAIKDIDKEITAALSVDLMDGLDVDKMRYKGIQMVEERDSRERIFLVIQ